MQSVKTYKALSNKIMFFGFLPSDLGVLLLLCMLFLGITNNIFYTLGFFLALYYFFKKLRHRTVGYFKSLILFINIPKNIGVSDADFKSYKDNIENVN